MSIFRNEKGIALVMVLILSVICLAITSALVYFVTMGTRISGIEKRYKTALEANIGGEELTYQLIGSRGDTSSPLHPANLGLTNFFITSSACLTDKLKSATSPDNWANCSDYSRASSVTIDTADSLTYDMRLDLGTNNVYAKIVDTVAGNSAGDLGLAKRRVVNSRNRGEIQVPHIPYLYTIEIQSQNTSNVDERAKNSVLYAY